MADILVIDGNRAKGRGWRNAFGEADHETTVLDNSADALGQCLTAAPDAVVVNMETLPSVGMGLSLVENLRAELPDAPIVVLAGGPLSLISGSLRELGADVCLSGPMDCRGAAKMVNLLLGHVAQRVHAKPARTDALERQLVR